MSDSAHDVVVRRVVLGVAAVAVGVGVHVTRRRRAG